MKTAVPSFLPALGMALLLATTPAWAQDSSGEEAPAPEDSPNLEDALPEETRTLLQEMLGRLSESMSGLVESLPRYGMPRINEEGDIVIPRLDPPPESEQKDPQAENDTEKAPRETGTDQNPGDTREI
ncbi:hypothetical protein ACFOW6_16130 [Fodinicurvata halophila]|uniref:AAA+ family ATPase n=1 Tax=Fodinicurvata halophila TaxID=1419723 RepID=A0ABV8UP35_9PROT